MAIFDNCPLCRTKIDLRKGDNVTGIWQSYYETLPQTRVHRSCWTLVPKFIREKLEDKNILSRYLRDLEPHLEIMDNDDISPFEPSIAALTSVQGRLAPARYLDNAAAKKFDILGAPQPVVDAIYMHLSILDASALYRATLLKPNWKEYSEIQLGYYHDQDALVQIAEIVKKISGTDRSNITLSHIQNYLTVLGNVSELIKHSKGHPGGVEAMAVDRLSPLSYPPIENSRTRMEISFQNGENDIQLHYLSFFDGRYLTGLKHNEGFTGYIGEHIHSVKVVLPCSIYVLSGHDGGVRTLHFNDSRNGNDIITGLIDDASLYRCKSHVTQQSILVVAVDSMKVFGLALKEDEDDSKAFIWGHDYPPQPLIPLFSISSDCVWHWLHLKSDVAAFSTFLDGNMYVAGFEALYTDASHKTVGVCDGTVLKVTIYLAKDESLSYMLLSNSSQVFAMKICSTRQILEINRMRQIYTHRVHLPGTIAVGLSTQAFHPTSHVQGFGVLGEATNPVEVTTISETTINASPKFLDSLIRSRASIVGVNALSAFSVSEDDEQICGLVFYYNQDRSPAVLGEARAVKSILNVSGPLHGIEVFYCEHLFSQRNRRNQTEPQQWLFDDWET